MLFFRQGEITDDQERLNLQIQSQEVGDEYQKGLALCVLSGIFAVIGVIMCITYGVYQSFPMAEPRNTLWIGGK